MLLKVFKEAGYEEALLGMSLSYYDHATPINEWWDDDKRERANKRAHALAFKGLGHNKFLESIQVWLYVQGSRAFWSEFDTYRAGVTKQSASSMHTLAKRSTTPADYEEGIDLRIIDIFNQILQSKPDITTLKANLPESWLQERMICTNYKALQNIVAQRHNHRLKHWPQFCNDLLAQLQHPYFICPTKSPSESLATE
jgi:hypothetical protein